MIAQTKTVVMSRARIEHREDVLRYDPPPLRSNTSCFATNRWPTCSELVKHRPTRVINCAGIRGYPNADWCEDHKVETMRTNVLGVHNVVDLCFQLKIHITHIGSACIYTLSEEEIQNRPPFKETDEPFFQGCWYGRSRLLSELSIRHYPNLLLLRIRLPIAADFHENNHITRLLKFEKIVDLTGVSVSFWNAYFPHTNTTCLCESLAKKRVVRQRTAQLAPRRCHPVRKCRNRYLQLCKSPHN